MRPTSSLDACRARHRVWRSNQPGTKPWAMGDGDGGFLCEAMGLEMESVRAQIRSRGNGDMEKR